ncbi:MAG TPA: ankyrin repeat domain-containing protein [Blastocatellia bacterium]|nr:ankyrin repeat domain-containing protein [Blastocatellia bacterium]
MRRFGLTLLFLLVFVQTPVMPQDKQRARNKLIGANTAFTDDAFIRSIIEGDKAKVELFLAAGMSPNTTLRQANLEIRSHAFSRGQTALLLALCLDHADIASLLLAHGADVNQPGQDATFPLLIAKGELVRELIERGANVNQKAEYGLTALMYAAAKGDLEKLTVLLQHGADVNVTNQSGYTALRAAAAARQRQALKLLIANGADLSGFSERAIRVMTSEPQPDDKVMQLINTLFPTKVDKVISGPSTEARQEVRARILEMANQSPESRKVVIERLIDVTADPAAQDQGTLADAWMTAVNVLGELRATEAIDVLVENLDRTGQNGIILSIHIKPVSSALENIGAPALPKLIQALSQAKPSIRIETAWVLFSIDKQVARAALEAACESEKDDSVKNAFKWVINRIDQGY